uniref:Uncharacterized protein n=1 Tax=viral metagenome TaxID=1070528 RepID=A0A6C0EBF8_9ZZZZ
MEQIKSQLEEYRQRCHKKYSDIKRKEYIYNKYKNLIILEEEKRSAYRIQSFFKKHITYEVMNLTPEEIEDIKGVNRYRMRIPMVNLEEINELYSHMENEARETYSDLDIVNVELFKIRQEKETNLSSMLLTAEKIPVLVDLSIYGVNPYIPICFEDKTITLTDQDMMKIKGVYEKTNPETLTGKKFIEMIEWSKAIRDAYVNMLQ